MAGTAWTACAQGNSFVIDGVSTNAGTTFYVGDAEPFSSLLITNGGNLNNQTGIIGNAASSSNNVAYISEPGSRWTSSVELFHGHSGANNYLEVSGGGRLNPGDFRIGYRVSSSNNVVLVDGVGSLLQCQFFGLGYEGPGNRVAVANGGRLASNGTYIGAWPSGTENSVVVTGSGSAWTNGNFLAIGAGGTGNSVEIREGGRVLAESATVGGFRGGRSSGNLLLVTDSGSSLTLSRWPFSDLLVGDKGDSNRVVIANGARIDNQNGFIGTPYSGEGNHNSVLVTGEGSVWSNRMALSVGYRGTNNLLTITDGGTVFATNTIIGSYPFVPLGNLVNVSGGSLINTNIEGSATLEVRNGMLLIEGGSVTADRLVAPNGSKSILTFNRGTLAVKSSAINTGKPFLVGDGTNCATLFLNGSVHTVADGLVVSHNSLLTGSGVITTTVTNAGTITLGAPIGSFTLNGSLSFEVSSRLGIDIGGTNQGVGFDFIGVSNSVHFGGNLRVSLLNGFAPANTDTFVVVGFTSATGAFANAADGGRVKTVDQLGSFRADYGPQTLILSDYRHTDADGDGIEDVWALQHFGHSPLTEAEKQADADNDGSSNHAEFMAGTDPTLATSVFKVLSLAIANGGAVTLRFSGVDEKSYRIWQSDDLNAWTEVAAPNLVAAEQGIREWISTTVSPASRRFYRVSVE